MHISNKKSLRQNAKIADYSSSFCTLQAIFQGSINFKTVYCSSSILKNQLALSLSVNLGTFT